MISRNLCIGVFLGAIAAACSSSGGSSGGPATARPCHIVDSSITCSEGSTDCYSAGSNSSCLNGALCTGDSGEMTCAFSCRRDQDCTADEATVCMQDCATTIVNGYCVTPSMRDLLLSTTCTTGSSDIDGVAGQ